MPAPPRIRPAPTIPAISGGILVCVSIRTTPEPSASTVNSSLVLKHPHNATKDRLIRSLFHITLYIGSPMVCLQKRILESEGEWSFRRLSHLPIDFQSQLPDLRPTHAT